MTETLRCWLSLHGSWDRTAVALRVHRNTVRQRIAAARRCWTRTWTTWTYARSCGSRWAAADRVTGSLSHGWHALRFLLNRRRP
ncbi:helix-turn-helix domain-containing protein [Streptomyces sp. M10(2022)]